MAPSTKAQKKAPSKFTLEGSSAVQEGIFEMDLFEKFLTDRIKVAGRTNNLGSAVTVKRNGANITVTVAPGTPFAKRYLKYLTKKFLKKKQLRDYLRVISTKKDTYALKYFKDMNGDEEEEDEE